jgi:uncharacterized C2H2 Zn-finger protein
MTDISRYQQVAGELVQCPRCHYIRSSRDFGATEACPRCGVAYSSIASTAKRRNESPQPREV